MPICSIVRAVLGSNLLLDFDDEIDQPFSIDGQQIIDAASFLRAVAIKFFPRGNESHSIHWTASKKNSGRVTEGMREAISHAIQLPRDEQDLKIYINDNVGTYYILQGAVIEAWGSAGGGARDFKSVSISGGVLKAITDPNGNGNEYVRPDGVSKYLRPNRN